MSYDKKCLDLAKYFTCWGTEQLAQHIQDSIEDFLSNPTLRIIKSAKMPAPAGEPQRELVICEHNTKAHYVGECPVREPQKEADSE